MKIEVLQSKLHPPAPGRLVRSRLVEALEQGRARGRRLSLLVAPAGYGKSTLAAQWVAGHASGWLTLDERDSSRARFLLYLAAALEPVFPGLASCFDRPLRSPEPPPTEALVELLVARVEALSVGAKVEHRSRVLVIDDYHEVSSREVHRALGLLLRYLPASIHVLVCSREDPPIPLALLRGRDDVTEVRQADLRFTDTEATQYLARVEGLDLPPQSAASLHRKTEGWVTALHFAALALRGAGTTSGIPLSRLEGLPGETATLDFLFSEALAGQKPEVARFLVLSSIFERFSRELCDAVLLDSLEGMAGCGPAIDSILRASLFVTALDGHGTWLRYHRLFRDLLRGRLEAELPRLVPELHERASRWFWDSGLHEEAVGHAFRSGNLARAAELVENVSRMIAVWNSVSLQDLVGWYRRLPPEQVEPRPWLRLYVARILLAAGQPAEGAAMLERLVEELAHSEGEERRELRTTAALDLASVDTVFGRVRRSLELLDSLPPIAERDARSARIHAARGMALLRGGDLEPCREQFSRALASAEGPAYALMAGTLLSSLCEVEILRGELHAALESSERALEASLQVDASSPAAGLALIQKARVLYEWNRLDEAVEAARRGLELTSAAGVTDAFGLGRVTCARIQLARGRVDEAVDILRETRSLARRYRVPRLADMVEASQVRVLLATQGPADQVSRWASRFAGSATPEYTRDREELVCARVEAVLGRHDRALARVDGLIDAARRGGRRYTELEARTVKALAHFAAGSKSGAFDLVSGVLEEAEPEGFLRLFLDEGEPLYELLRQARSQVGIPRCGDAVIRAFEGAGGTPALHGLTARERQVLALVSERLGNEEIADRLFVSLPTVKTHVSHILAKLGVASRREAAARGRELGL